MYIPPEPMLMSCGVLPHPVPIERAVAFEESICPENVFVPQIVCVLVVSTMSESLTAALNCAIVPVRTSSARFMLFDCFGLVPV